MQVWILARQDDNHPDGPPARTANFRGEVNWPSVPPEGGNWIHCGGWAVESFYSVFYSSDSEEPPIQIVVEVSEEVLDHLIEEHEFKEFHT